MVWTARVLLILMCAGTFLLSSLISVNASTLQRDSLQQTEQQTESQIEQSNGANSLAIHILKESIVLIRIDGTLKFSGTLEPDFHAQWVGDSLYLEVESGGAVQVTLNDQYFGVYGATAQTSVLNWPPTLHSLSLATKSTEPPNVVQRIAPTTPIPVPTGTPATDPTSAPNAVPLTTTATALTGQLTEQPTAQPTRQPTAARDSEPPVVAPTSTSVPTPVLTTINAAESVADPIVAVQAEPKEYYYTVQAGEVLSTIAAKFGLSTRELAQANEINNPALIQVGMRLRLPNYVPSVIDQTLGVESSVAAAAIANSDEAVAFVDDISPETAFNRLTSAAQVVSSDSPYYYTTYVTYYGRPNVPIMGILGEYSIDALTPLLKRQAEAYDEANGPQLRVKPAFHLVYGMAARAPGRNGTHLVFLEDEVVQAYIDRAQQEGFDVILDVQIGALHPAESLSLAFKWLKYPNVHLGLDPEFAMSHAGQAVPGNPIGFVTAAQVNESQRLMQDYMHINRISGSRILLLHQFIDRMIVNKPALDWSYNQIDLTISVDGWGGPWNKITKYNSFVNESTEFSAFKLFYRWDEPVLSEAVSMGSASYGDSGYYRMKTTPNLIIYQ